MITERQAAELTGKGDCREHYHLEDRGPFEIPHGSFYDLTTQTAALTTAAYPMTLGNTITHNGVDLDGSTKVVVRQPGIYNIQFSAQFANPAAGEHNAAVWLAVGGVDVVASTRIISVPAKHGAFLGHHIAAWNFMQRLERGDYFELMWAVDDIQVYIAYLPLSAGPPSRPSTPSVAVTVGMVSI
jgi:hypothetical protein